MDKFVLLKKISKPISKNEAVGLASKTVDFGSELIKLSLDSNYEVAFRAAWVLELVALNYTGEFKKLVPEFIQAYIILANQSSQRHYTKVLMHLTSPGTINQHLSDVDLEPIVETTFEWMIDPQTPVAVKVNCMDILYNLRDKQNWISEELAFQIGFQLRNGSAALQSRGKKVLNKLAKYK